MHFRALINTINLQIIHNRINSQQVSVPICVNLPGKLLFEVQTIRALVGIICILGEKLFPRRLSGASLQDLTDFNDIPFGFVTPSPFEQVP